MYTKKNNKVVASNDADSIDTNTINDLSVDFTESSISYSHSRYEQRNPLQPHCSNTIAPIDEDVEDGIDHIMETPRRLKTPEPEHICLCTHLYRALGSCCSLLCVSGKTARAVVIPMAIPLASQQQYD